MLTRYTKSDMFADIDAGKSLNDDFTKFCRNLLFLQTTLQVILNSFEIYSHIHMMSQSNKVQHQEFILDTYLDII